MGTLLLIIGIIALIVGVVGFFASEKGGDIAAICGLIVLICINIPFKENNNGEYHKTDWLKKIQGKPPIEVIKQPGSGNTYENEARKKQLQYLAGKIRSQKTNRTYNDGIYSTPIYNDDNGRDYIIMRTEDNSTIKMVYLDNKQERILDQGVAFILGL